MRITITGSHGTGKTTLVQHLLSYLKEQEQKNGFRTELNTEEKIEKIFAGRLPYRFLPETAVQAYRLGLPINEYSSIETEVYIFAKQLEMEMRYADNWIADKCFVDLLAYAQLLFKHDYALMEILKKIAIPRMHKYDKVIYVPTGEFPIEDDGIRSLDPDFQKEVDTIVVSILKENRISYQRIVGDKEERFRAAVKYIQS